MKINKYCKGGEIMNWKKAIGFGLLLWIIMFVVISVFVGFDIYKYIWIQIVTALIAGIISYILTGKIKPSIFSLALSYGLVWVAIGLILDLVVTTRFNAAIFSSWTLWLGYILILVVPVLKVKKRPI
ncbi:MAG: hypothetical protein V1712_03730 [Patescibacteria group bacterium]